MAGGCFVPLPYRIEVSTAAHGADRRPAIPVSARRSRFGLPPKMFANLLRRNSLTGVDLGHRGVNNRESLGRKKMVYRPLH